MKRHAAQNAVKPYELPRNTKFLLDGAEYLLETIDGAYSRCFDNGGNLYHFNANTEVSKLRPIDDSNASDGL